MYITIEVNHSELHQELYNFWVNDSKLILNSYGEYTRPTKRHKLTVVKSYNRLDSRRSSLKKEDMALTEHVMELAKKQFIEQITVTI